MSGSLSSFSAISISSLLYATLALSIARLLYFIYTKERGENTASDMQFFSTLEKNYVLSLNP